VVRSRSQRLLPIATHHSHRRHHFRFFVHNFEHTVTVIMPALVHLVPRLDVGGNTGGILATSIGLIVGLGIVPVVILVWVVSWLFWCYPYDRSCCCTRRKKKQADPELDFAPAGYTVANPNTIHEKGQYTAPQRPANNFRSESGNSAPNGNRLTKTDPRMSMNTIASNSTIQVTHEPKPFV
jgi:hypothetical protein